MYASLNGALGLDDVELLSAKKFGLQESCFASGVRVGISNFRYMLGLFHCLQYYLLVVDDGLYKRKFVLYFCYILYCAHFVAHFISSHVV